MAAEQTPEPDVSGHLEADGSVTYSDLDAMGTPMQTESPPDLSEEVAALAAEVGAGGGRGYDNSGYVAGGEAEYDGNEQPEYEQHETATYEQAIDEAIAEAMPDLYSAAGYEPDGQYEQEYEGPSVGEAVAEAVADTTVLPQQQQAFDQLLEQQPELAHPVVVQALEPVLEEIAEIHGLDAAVHPEVVEHAFQAIGGIEAFRDQIEETDIVDGMLGWRSQDLFT